MGMGSKAQLPIFPIIIIDVEAPRERVEREPVQRSHFMVVKEMG